MKFWVLYITRNLSPSDSVGLAHCRLLCLFVFSVCVCVHVHIHTCENFKAFVKILFAWIWLKQIALQPKEKILSLNQHDFQWPIYFMGHLRNNKFQSKLCVVLLYLWQSRLTCTAIWMQWLQAKSSLSPAVLTEPGLREHKMSGAVNPGQCQGLGSSLQGLGHVPSL